MIWYYISSIIYFIRSHSYKFIKYRRYLNNWFLFKIRGHFGLLLLISFSFSIHYLLHLLSTSFTTEYSIIFRPKPITKLPDLLSRSKVECVAFKNFDCFYYSSIYFGKSNPIVPINLQKLEQYLKENFDRHLISIFASSSFYSLLTYTFCRVGLLKKRQNFYVHSSSLTYYETSSVLVYNKYLMDEKKRWLIKRSYSCIENGYCRLAYGRTLRIFHRTYNDIKLTDGQCNHIRDSSLQARSSYHPIAFPNIVDILTWTLSLSSFATTVFLIECFAKEIKSRFKSHASSLIERGQY